MRGHCQDLAAIGIHDDEGASFTILREHVLTDALKIFVEGGNDIVARNGRAGDSLRGLIAASVISDMELTDLSAKFVVENLLETFPALAIREEEIVVLDRSHREGRFTAGITDDMASQRTVRIEAHVRLPQNQVRSDTSLNDSKFLRTEILNNVEWQHSAILIVIENYLVRDGDYSL